MATPVSYTWIPSTARIVRVDGFGSVPRGTLQTPPPRLVWPAKDPADTLDYVFDISEALAGNEGDSIATLDVVIGPAAPGDLVVKSATADGDQAVLWLSGGFADTTYSVTVTVGTNSGRLLSRTISLPVLLLATPPVSASAITDQGGAPITDQASQPITTS